MTKKNDDSKKPEPADEGSRIDSLEKEKADLTDTLKRVAAEFDNYKKRVEREKAEFREYAAREFAGKLLPILDSFEIAIKNSDDGHEKKGLELIYSQLFTALEKEGLRPINSVGERLDPYRHEALLSEKTDDAEKDGVVAEELSRGYMWKDSVLRTGKVKIFKH